MAEEWRRLARQLRDFPTYLARLRSHELPTMIVSAIDNRALLRSQGRLMAPEDDHEMQEIVRILQQMVASKWSFAADVSVTAEQQRILDYAHNWAGETLLSLVLPESGEQEPPEKAPAIGDMERALFLYHAHAPSDRLAHLEVAVQEALRCNERIRPQQATHLLESCLTVIDDDIRCIELVEKLAVKIQGEPTVFSPVSPKCMARILTRRAPSQKRMFDELSLTARVALWASDVALWMTQLEEWLIEVHERPFADVKTMIRGRSDHGVVIVCPSHLYDTLVAWIMDPRRRKWLCSSRSRSLLYQASRLTRNDKIDHIAFTRHLFAKVPTALLHESNRWTSQQQAFALGAITRALPTDEPLTREVWYEFGGLIERSEIVHVAVSAVIGGSTERSFHSAVDLIAWYYSVIRPDGVITQKEDVRSAIEETANGIGGEKDWSRGAEWLKLHRSSAYATFTLTRLRITWRWVLTALSQGSGAKLALSEALDSLEYIIRRYAPAGDSRQFQVEAVSILLEDLDWMLSHHGISSVSDGRGDGTMLLIEWIRKLTKLVPSGISFHEPQHLSQQLAERLDAMGLELLEGSRRDRGQSEQ